MLHRATGIITAWFNAERAIRARRNSRQRLARFESLEGRELLAINWVNAATNNFDAIYNTAADPSRGQKAVEIVKRAITDWEAVIVNFNFLEDSDGNPDNDLNNTFALTINAGELGGNNRGGASNTGTALGNKPKAATVTRDNNGGNAGWFFDPTPRDDAEFSAVVDAFAANFIDVGSTYPPFGLYRDDFYRTVVHEIGHALGITSNPNLALSSMLTSLRKQDSSFLYDPLTQTPNSIVLRRFQSTRPNPTFGITATFTESHIYEGSVNDPVTAYLGANGTSPVPFQRHPNELLNPGRSVPVGNPNGTETTRQFISDLDAKILADAYGYTVVLPSSLNNAFVSLDEQTGTLLVQVQPNAQFDSMSVFPSAANIVTNVNGFFEVVPGHLVQRIIIAGNRGSDTVSVTGNHPVTGAPLQSLRTALPHGRRRAVSGAESPRLVPGRVAVTPCCTRTNGRRNPRPKNP